MATERTPPDVDTSLAPRELLDRFPLRPSDAAGIGSVIRTGSSEVYPEISEDVLAAVARDDEHLALLKRVGFGTGMAIPLRARGRSFGAFSLANEQGRPMGSEDLFLAEELAARAAMAIDNARLYEDRAYVARTLQTSLLPPRLPEIPGMDLAARYLPASHDVGGDFYDVFPLDPRRWLLAVGDVCGKGPTAAALTGLIRSTVRAVAMQERDPARVLEKVNLAMMSQLEEPKLFTMVLAVFDRTRQAVRLTIACAGHLLPLVVRASGVIEPGAVEGTLLGVFPDPRLTDHAVDLHPGDALVFFTDGAIDPRASDESQGLGLVLRELSGAGPSALADAVVGRSSGERVHDDVAVLVLTMPA